MACDDSTNASTALSNALAGPSLVTVDGNTVQQHPLAALIAVDQYMAGKCAASNPRRGIRFNVMIPDGASSTHGRRYGPYGDGFGSFGNR